MVVKAVDFKFQLYHLLGLENSHLPTPNPPPYDKV